MTIGSPGQDLDVVLSQPHGGRSQEEADALLELVTKGSIQAAIFSSTDLDRTFEQSRGLGCRGAAGAEVPTLGRCAVRDPSGNLIRIAQA